MNNTPSFAARRPLTVAASIVFAVLLGGCAGMPWGDSNRAPVPAVSTDAASPVDVPPRELGSDGDGAKRRLAEGIGRYEAGDYVGAIRALNAAEIVHAAPSTRIQAEKYLAFSYCLTERRTLCREAFDRALALDSAFRLQPAEAGHPLWGPVYAQARKAAGQRTN